MEYHFPKLKIMDRNSEKNFKIYQDQYEKNSNFINDYDLWSDQRQIDPDRL